ncbi:MAG: twin-arginine translocation signal domain-containing protein [Verrucomicrobiae bacterium]|nr:twin-arginine translocation signal domain-containing protein [Verrucomicrobiae bacterium]
MKPLSAEAKSLGVSRRGFLKTSAALGGSLVFGHLPDVACGASSRGATTLAVADLPAGAAPLPVTCPHFPSPLHTFVWRNWSLVPIERMARAVGARRSDLVRMGRAMGIGAPPRISRDQQARSYLTVIKRNWHLLPYDQLLELLGWDAEQLAYTLREDDFLFIKLGSLKPRCEPLRYQPPDEAVLQREREIAQTLREECPALPARQREPLFTFVSQLSRLPAARPRTEPTGKLSFCYSYFALYGDPLLEPEADPYPEGLLARLAQAGVNGVWLQAVLYKLAPFPWEPDRSAQHEIRLKNLRQLVARARQHGIRLFLYLNEPRMMPLRFFEDRPQLKGVVDGDHAALCTSAPEVQEYMVNAVATICRAVPDLGGFFSITASENPTNCWSHGKGAQCPLCRQRTPAEVIAGVSRLFAEGIRRAGTNTELIAWDWGWNDAWAGDAIRQLPAEAALMSVSEWRLPIQRGGVKTEVGEYSISAIGPGPRATQHWQLARERGLRAIAKIQAGNTWELSAVPYIPAVENVARHAESLRGADVSGLMLGWTLGGYPSPNLEVVAETLAGGSADAAMRRVAERRFGPRLAPAVVEAWRGFSSAFREFPYHIGVVYSGPQQLGPANLLWGEPTGYRATMVGFPYDDLNAWRAVYPPEVFIQQLNRVADGFDQALRLLESATAELQPKALPTHRQALEAEARVAEAAMIHFRSAANQARFVMARGAWSGAKTPAETDSHRAELRCVLNAEIALARRLFQLQSRDSRLGFEASNHYFYVPCDLQEKILNCRHLLDHWLAAQG